MKNFNVDFAERMQKIVQILGNIAELSRRVDVAYPTAQKWVKEGAEPSTTNLVKIAEVSGVNLEWLATGKGEPFPRTQNKENTESDPHTSLQISLARSATFMKQAKSEKHKEQGTNGVYDTQGNPVDIGDFVFIPYYNVSLSAGHGSWVDSEQPTHSLAFRRDWLTLFVTSNLQKLSVVKVKGDSMVGVFNDSDTILIDHSQTEPHDDLYAIRLGNEVFVKRLQRLPHKLMVISANPEYPPFEINMDDSDFAVIGKVVWLGRLV